MLEAWSGRECQHFVTVETPGQAIPHIHEGGSSAVVHDRVGIDAIREGAVFDGRILACGKSKGKWIGVDCFEPGIELWLNRLQSQQKWFVGTAEHAKAFHKVFQADVGGPTASKWGGTNLGDQAGAVRRILGGASDRTTA